MTLLVVLLVALLQSPPASVEGVAIKAGTTEPIAHARVMLTSVEGRLTDTRVADTDERGRFAFRGVAAGAYRLLAQHDAFVRAAGRTVTIAPGQSLRDLVVAMTPTGVITGRVVDEYGAPVPDVYVRASQKDSTFEATTNDLGEYRLFGLPPGAYVVSAAPYPAARIENEMKVGNLPPTAMIITPTRPSPYSPGEGQGMVFLANVLKNGDFIPFMALRRESHATVYYPGTTDATAAAPMEVPPGAVIGGINFVTQATKSTK
jgi:carboxypeptidase family protein